MSKRGRTVEEIRAELSKDPVFLKRQRERDERERKNLLYQERAFEPLLRELANEGFVAPSLNQLADCYAPLPPAAVEILLSWIPMMPDDSTKETIVRQLATAAEPFDGTPLVACFEATSNESLRWAILYAISCTKPYSIDEWLQSTRGTWVEETLRKLS